MRETVRATDAPSIAMGTRGGYGLTRLLGKTWGQETTTLKFESRFDPALMQALQRAGHNVEVFVSGARVADDG